MLLLYWLKMMEKSHRKFPENLIVVCFKYQNFKMLLFGVSFVLYFLKLPNIYSFKV